MLSNYNQPGQGSLATLTNALLKKTPEQIVQAHRPPPPPVTPDDYLREFLTDESQAPDPAPVNPIVTVAGLNSPAT